MFRPSLALALLFLALPSTAGAQASRLQLRADALVVDPGQSVTVDVRLVGPTTGSTISALFFAGFQIAYDSAAFAYASFAPGTLLTSATVGPLNQFGPTATFADGQPVVAFSVSGQCTTSGGATTCPTVTVPAGGGSLGRFTFATKAGATGRHTFRALDVSLQRYVSGTLVALTSTLESVSIDRRRAAVSTSTASVPTSGDSTPSLPADAGGATVSFSGLSTDAGALTLTVRRVQEAPAGTAAPDAYVRAGATYTTLSLSDAATFSAEVCLPLSQATLVPPENRSQVRLARRRDAASAWEVLPTTFVPSGTPTSACGTVTGFSDFELVAPPAALPVELTGLAATADGARVRLAWTTASETNNAGFDVELAPGPSAGPGAGPDAWERVAFVAGRGTTAEATAYRVATRPLAAGRYRLRLVQIDHDGTRAPSPVVEATVAGAAAVEIVPAGPGAWGLVVRDGGHVRATLYDALGRTVGVLADAPLAAAQAHRLALPAGLAPGVYVLRAQTARGSASQALVVTR